MYIATARPEFAVRASHCHIVHAIRFANTPNTPISDHTFITLFLPAYSINMQHVEEYHPSAPSAHAIMF